MTTLSDLPLSQITRAYGAIAKIKVHPRRFSCKSSAISNLEQLLAEKGLTTADALRAAGIEAAEPTDASAAAEPAAPLPPRFLALDDIETDEDGCELEQVEDGDIPGTEDPPEPGMLWSEPEQGWRRPEQDLSATPDITPPATSQADLEPAAPLSPVEDQLAPSAPETPEAAAVLASNRVVNDTRDLLVRYLIDSAGLDPETAVLAALRAVAALKLPEQPQPATGRQPRTGSKQGQVIALLRRPEGATIAQMVEATGWLSHTCRGALAGTLKKKLGLTIASAKLANGERVYHLRG